MRNLVVCCDGTWNTPDQRDDGVPVPTNVVRLYNALAERDGAGNAQLRYYHPGVGTDGTWWQKIMGGALGAGLDANIMSAYRWLGGNFAGDDRVFLFGFSRGAFTVRSLAGMISACGLLDLRGLAEDEVWRRVADAYNKRYRAVGPAPDGWADNWPFHAADSIHFLGVWDTVGALGIPDDMALLNLIDDPQRFAFHDTALSDKVLNARHALALDERRASFTPTLWTGVGDRETTVRQLWFAGVHADVGGGYPEIGLSDVALEWMIGEAGGLGLAFNPNMTAQLRPDPRGVLHDSRTRAFRLLRSQPRSIPPVALPDSAAVVHGSAFDRHANPPVAQAPYRLSAVPGPGEERRLSVYAAEPWNDTGIYLEAGARYAFAAAGEWLDRTVTAGPGGTDDGTFQMGEVVHVAASVLGRVETLWRKVSGNAGADFRFTRRHEDWPWFALIGVIANGGNPTNDGTPEPHTAFLIGEGCTFPADGEAGLAKPGYLYCFANDAWHFYGNNRGSVRLTVRRLE